MSGDSPNAFSNDRAFDFREGGRSSPGPTSSKEHHDAVVASVLVEPPKDKPKEKEKDEKDKEDEPDFSTPILNPGAEGHGKKQHDGDDKASGDDSKRDGGGGGHDSRGKSDKNHSRGDGEDERDLFNGKLPNTPYGGYNKNSNAEEEEEDDKCIVNCIYYTMECCKCTIL